MDGRTQVFLPAANEDIVYVFAHILQHFYKGGIGLRQICDWCRLMWTYRDTLDLELLEKRIRKAGLLDEWKTFGAFAVKYLGMRMPIEAMPLYLNSSKYQVSGFKKKADRIMDFILKTGNFGHNRDMSFYREDSYLGQKVKSFERRMEDMWNHFKIFPMDTLRFMPRIVYNGLRSAMRGE